MAGFLDRFRQNPDDPYYQALARGLQDFGFGLAGGAGEHGLAAAAPAAAYGVQSYADTYQRATAAQQKAEEERRAREEQAVSRGREDTRWRHYMEKWEAAKTEGERERAEAEAGAAEEKERREAMLAAIGETGGSAARQRAALLSPTKLESEYVKVTGEPEAPKAPTTRSFPDGSLRQWNGKGWEVLQEEPAGAGAETPSEQRARIRFDQSQADRAASEKSRSRAAAEAEAKGEVGTWESYRDARLAELAKLHPGTDWSDPQERALKIPGIRKMYDQQVRERADRSTAGGERPAAAPARSAPASAPPAAAPAAGAGGVPEGMTFDQAMALMREKIGNNPAAVQAVAEVEAAAQVVPPQVRDSRQFLEQLRSDLLAGKSPQQIAQEIREAFGGGG